MSNIHMNSQGIGHAPKGTVANITAFLGMALIVGSFISGREEFLYGATSMAALRFIGDLSDRS